MIIRLGKIQEKPYGSGIYHPGLSTTVLFSQKIVERASENNKPRNMTANVTALRARLARKKIKRLWTDYHHPPPSPLYARGLRNFLRTPIHKYFKRNAIKTNSFVLEIFSNYLVKHLSKRLFCVFTTTGYNRRRSKKFVTFVK